MPADRHLAVFTARHRALIEFYVRDERIGLCWRWYWRGALDRDAEIRAALTEAAKPTRPSGSEVAA